MVNTIGCVWCLLIILKPIFTLEYSSNIYHQTVVCGLICRRKQQSKQLFIFKQNRRGYVQEKNW